MKRIWIGLLIVCPFISIAQLDNGFPFGKITLAELDMSTYAKDTSANAVVLDEFGEAYVDNYGDHNLLLEYHIKIKILKKQGVDEANFSISLRKDGSRKEFVKGIAAITFNLNKNSIKETKMEKTAIFVENYNEYWDITKFTLPDAQVGSVLDIKYTLESPFIFNFFPWKFQSNLPKMKSEFWSRIPANYVYYTTLQGYLKLTRNESTLIKDCFTPGGSAKADCSWNKYAMIDIPAFVEEDYMTAKSNFVASINYELSQVKYFDGRVDNYTKSWPDVDIEMRKHQDFGTQIKKAGNLLEDHIVTAIGAEKDSQKKAALVYDHIRNYYSWDGYLGKYAELGAKKAFESKKGNVGDINLALVAALQAAGLNADPVMLSTRDNGVPHELHPVMSDFNYVVAHVNFGDSKVLLDATEKLLPFGLLPQRCLNGKGRLISKSVEETGWVEIKSREKQNKKIILNLKLGEDKVFRGDLSITSSGYEAFDKRVEILGVGGEKDYKKKIEQSNGDLGITEYTLENLDDITKPLIEKMNVESRLETSNPSIIYLNPFLADRWETNPFKSNSRMYPVDFGVPLETTYMLTLEFPEQFVVDELPANAAVTLPQNGGRYLFSVTNLANKISLTSIISLSKTAYSPGEYPSLRELYNRIVQLHQSQVVFKSK